MRSNFLLFVILALLVSLVHSAHAQWQPDGVALCTAANNQANPTIVSDGAGGAIVTWFDNRRPNIGDVYAQRVDGSGVPQWTADGVALCTAGGGGNPMIVSDGAGGAIVTWTDFRSGTNQDIYAQRMDASGAPQWTTDGVALCTAAYHQFAPTIVSDNAGGAIVTWYDDRGTYHTNYDIYAQRVDASGVPQWTSDGVALCTEVSAQGSPTIVSDGAGGAIVTWYDDRSGNHDIYAQRVGASGVPQWTSDGVALCTAANRQDVPTIVSDGAGGAIVTWWDRRSGTNSNIYAQRVNASGAPQWTADGVDLSTAARDPFYPTIVSDAAGGAIVTWHTADASLSDIYAQRVSASGAPQWTADGVALCTAEGTQQYPMIDSDGAGGAIVTWVDYRNGPAYDIYAQRVNASGVSQWTADGVALCTAASVQAFPTIASDGAGGAIVTWQDGRRGPFDIYAQRVEGPLLSVAITSFSAIAKDGAVEVRSTFRSDLGIEAVNVYRGNSADEPLARIETVAGVSGEGFVFVDRAVTPGETYRYQIGVEDADGEFFSQEETVTVNAPRAELAQNSPNPFNPTTTIRFVLPTREHVTLRVYDAGGRLVCTLVDEMRAHGANEATWDGRDDHGGIVSSGVYFYRLNSGSFVDSKTMVLLK